MHRRRFLVGVASGGVVGLAGCMGAGEGVDARRVSVNATVSPNRGRTNPPSTPAGTSSSPGRVNTTSGTATPLRRDDALVLSSHEFYRQRSSAGVRGRVADRGSVDLDYVSAHTRFFDRAGDRIATGTDNESGFEVGETWRFDTRLLDTDPARVARYWLVVIDQRSSEVENPFEKSP